MYHLHQILVRLITDLDRKPWTPEDQWEEIIKYRMHIGDGFRIVKEGNSYNVEYLLNKKKVASNMFSNCINLKSLTLPENISR